MTVLAVLAQFKAGGIATTIIAGGTFAETWEAYHKYNRLQTLAAWLSLILIVIGTVIWAYGDLVFPEPPDDSEEQTAALVGRFSTAALHPAHNLGLNRNPDKIVILSEGGLSFTLPRRTGHYTGTPAFPFR